jgi:hypothetical protein
LLICRDLLAESGDRFEGDRIKGNGVVQKGNVDEMEAEEPQWQSLKGRWKGEEEPARNKQKGWVRREVVRWFSAQCQEGQRCGIEFVVGRNRGAGSGNQVGGLEGEGGTGPVCLDERVKEGYGDDQAE